MHTFVPRTLAVAAATVVLALLAVLTGAPAEAHTGLESSTPADGEALTRAPDTVTLTFAAAVASQFVQVAVTGPDGRSVTTGQATVEGAVVRQPVSPDVDGSYLVAYRVVSEDGHPISGKVGFTLAGAVATPATTSPAGPASPSPTARSTPAPATASPAAAAEITDGSGWDPWLLLVSGVVVVLGVGAVAGLRRRRSAGR